MITLAIAALLAPQSTDYVWIEAEKPTTKNVIWEPVGWGHKEFLSGDAWSTLIVDQGDMAKKIPAEGMNLTYKFTTESAGNYEGWNRIGYEWIRSDFRWRIDGGAWTTVSKESPTTDLMSLAEWNEVAWIPIGKSDLSKGEHVLEINVERPAKDRLVYASDAIVFSKTPFHPYSRFKPDENHLSQPMKENVFALGSSTFEGRPSVQLKGEWQIAREDEFLPPTDIAQPMPEVANNLRWKPIQVPGDKNEDPALTYAHRVWYKTSFNVPEKLAGRSYQIKFPANNLNTTVYVNGKLCGFEKNPYVSFFADVTAGVKPGKNELLVGIRDAWYGFSTNPRNPMKLRKNWNTPIAFTKGFTDLAYPVWNAFQSGILVTPTLVASGEIYASDVFVKPAVAQKALNTEITLTNITGQTKSVEITCEAIDPKTQAVAVTLPPVRATLNPNSTLVQNVNGPWSNPTLWWPDAPNMYTLRTVVKADGKTIDTRETSFGFREWSVKGTQFYLNGIIYRTWADLSSGDTPEEAARIYHKVGLRTIRSGGYAQNGLRWRGLDPEDSLDFMDRNGIVNRRSGILDGEAIGYMAIENDPDLKKDGEIKWQLLRNWKDQMVGQVKAERNHPSIMLWSTENEFLYINCINLYGGLMDEFEKAVLETSKAVSAADPTRTNMVDGGGAGKGSILPVHGDHYVFGDFTQYPSRAYETYAEGGGRGRWLWDQKRPRYIGEDYFANGINPAEFAAIGGETAFLGKVQAKPAGSLMARILTEGYRWQGYAAWHFWMSPDNATTEYYNSFKDRAVFTREWDSAFTSGSKFNRTFGIFNDTRFSDPIVFTRTLTVGGKSTTKTTTHTIAPGESVKFPEAIAAPTVTARTDGTLGLTLSVAGKEVFRDVKPISILPTPRTQLSKPVAVYDPQNQLKTMLTRLGINAVAVTNFKSLPAGIEVLIVAPNALTLAQSADPLLASLAMSGKKIIVLDQQNPLKFQGLPAEVDAANNDGRAAFWENPSHPVAKGLRDSDLFTFPVNDVVYQNAYLKPRSGAKSLVQCHERLSNSAMLEIPVGKGLILISQLSLGKNLDAGPVAQKILTNLVDYAGTYVKQTRTAASVVTKGGQFDKALGAIGMSAKAMTSPVEAISGVENLAAIEATPSNLKALVAAKSKLDAFTAKGGWVVFNGLTPEGLDDYNKLVGFDHMIRPFRREKVTFSARRNPIAAGLNTGDIVLLSSERIFDFTSDVYVADDTFKYVVDGDEVAPFAELPNDYMYNTVNGFVSGDAWKLIFSFDLKSQKPEYVMKFPKAQTFTQIEWTGNAFYHRVKKFQLTFDGKNTVTFEPEPNNLPQIFKINPGQTGKNVELKITEWTEDPGMGAVVGIDNIRLTAQRPTDFASRVQPLLSSGGLVAYPRGKGGILLANLQFKDTESVPENAGKKRRILSTLLRNLDAPIGGQSLIVPGAGLTYTPIDLSKSANQYINERGWFGDKNFTFKDLPAGKQNFGGVTYNVFEFLTSPVPTAVMLGGSGVPGNLPEAIKGIKVGQKASALFFLHTARIDRSLDDRERRENIPVEVAKYIVHYADGTAAEVPVLLEKHIDSYRQSSIRYLPSAVLAWTKPFANSDELAVAYSMQWSNPKPGVEIASIDLVYGKDRRAVPALLAISAAK